MTFLSIIILNWNGIKLLPECLHSISEQSYKNFECIVVDNGSNDGSANFIKKNFSWVKLIELEQNVGFAKGNNIGFSHTHGEYIFTLNNDTVLDRNCLKQVVRTVTRNPQAGMIGCKICSYYKPEKIDSIGLKICLDGMARGFCRGKKTNDLPYDIQKQFFLPSACAALYKRSMIEKTGFFDEDFFAYCEDTDLGLRGLLGGWPAILAENAFVYHKYSETTGKFSPLKLYLIERNHFWVAIKNFPAILLLLLPLSTLMRYFIQFLSVVKHVGSGRELLESKEKSELLKAALRGVYDAICSLSAMLIKRKKQYKNFKPHNHLKIIRNNLMNVSQLFDI